LRWLALLLVLFILGRYLEVTAPALYGRRINLYWDGQHLPRVAAMLAENLPSWQVWLIGSGVIGLLISLYLLVRVLLHWLVAALAQTPQRGFALVLSAALLVLYTLGQLQPQFKTHQWFSLPVSMTYTKQLMFLRDALVGEPMLDTATAPLPQTSLAGLDGADVLLLFFESYGAITLDRATFRQALAPSRKSLSAAIATSGRQVVSARVSSPTFGGASWLAHASFLSGIEVSDNQGYQWLLTQTRDTLVHRFAAQGYRTAGLMPGLRQAWPEGAFYGYAQIYDAESLAYPGPAFGWWRIPDQYALARFDHEELAPQARPPLLAVMNSISSHAPFRAVPPYLSDWQDLLGPDPYANHAPDQAEGAKAGSNEMGQRYVKAVEYVLTYLTGYLEHRARDDLVLIVLGDHQPAARVSGTDASWDVPMHVITPDAELIEALEAEGFESGLEPSQPAIGPMHEMATRLLRAFSGSPRQGRMAAAAAHSPGHSTDPI
jgi:hypothetical protein